MLLAVDGSPAAARISNARQYAVIVPDVEQKIANAYQVTAWPTTLFLDEDGIIEQIRYGLINAADLAAAGGPRNV